MTDRPTPRPSTPEPPECWCGIDENPDGPRLDIVCPKHDDDSARADSPSPEHRNHVRMRVTRPDCNECRPSPEGAEHALARELESEFLLNMDPTGLTPEWWRERARDILARLEDRS